MSTVPARRPPHAGPWSDPRLVVPSAERWTAMTPAERDREEERLLGVLDEYREDRLEEAERSQKETADRLEALRTGMAGRILRILAARGLAVTEAQRAQVTACEELDRLLDWLERASSAATIDDVLAP
jgi:hypothetical protein